MSSSWIAICIPLFVIFFIVLPQKHEMKKLIILKRKKRKGLIIMTNELIKKYKGKTVSISTGEFGTSATGKIIDVKENWIEVETKKGIELINSEFIQSIKITQ
ncbi:hypothetical protein LGK95_12430 [Clostridium algoriphilum]|uniref:hypothetical protein n=1 Tax=Clostridium algoriphilum TaxID=198347 RepID=UPI001CF0D89C|nr:hypothetical protein [Clostridium algoriphilum]MCB2294317.1 hypothetical protein [Clostridium algoriphilum]